MRSWLIDGIARATIGSPGVPPSIVEQRFLRTIIGHRSKRDIYATEDFAAYFKLWKLMILTAGDIEFRMDEFDKLQQHVASLFPETEHPDKGTEEADMRNLTLSLRDFVLYHMRVVEVCNERRFAVSRSG
jgi:hypothetical protein